MHYSIDESKAVVAINGKCKLVVYATKFFGGDDSQTYWSDELNSPTWGTIFNCAKQSVKVTKDTHHTFFEGVGYKGVVDGVDVYQIYLGS